MFPKLRSLQLLKSLLYALAGTTATSVSLCATTVDFTSASYTTGNLNGQNGWSVQEDSRYNGAMNIVQGTGLRLIPTTNGGAGPAAFYGTTSTLAPNTAYTTSINFNFTESAGSLTTPSDVTRLTFSGYINPYCTACPFVAAFSRAAGTDAYQISLVNNAGSGSTMTGTTTVSIPGSALGLNFAAGHPTSDPLQFSFKMTEGANVDAWTLVATIQNLNSGVTYTATASVTGAAGAFWFSAMYETIQNYRNVSWNNPTADGLSTFTITQFDAPSYSGPPGTYLTFSDHFTTGSLNPSKWLPFFTSSGNINSEQEVYVPGALTFPVGGGLSIKADHPAQPVQGQPYTSGAMTTYGNFSQTYGYFEMRAQMPKGAGFWPAFWLLADNQSWPPEIDVLEMPQSNNPAYGQPLNVNTVHTTLHWLDGNNTHQGDGAATTTSTDYSAGYHTYAVSWLPNSMVFYVDGMAVHTINGSQVPNVPMYLLVNFAVGGSWPGSPDATTPFPAYMKVAYVHVYQYNNAPAVPKAPLVFSPTTLSTATVARGGTLTLRSSVKVGPNALAGGGGITAYITDFWGGQNAPTYTSNSISVPATAANSTVPFTLTLNIPANMPTGTYTIWYYLWDPNAQVGLYLAQRFDVQ